MTVDGKKITFFGGWRLFLLRPSIDAGLPRLPMDWYGVKHQISLRSSRGSSRKLGQEQKNEWQGRGRGTKLDWKRLLRRLTSDPIHRPTPCMVIQEIFACRIRNPGLWSLIQFLESGIQVPLTKNPDSSGWNPESPTVLDYLQGMDEIQLVIRAEIEPGTSGWTVHSAPLSLSHRESLTVFRNRKYWGLINTALSVPSNRDRL